MITREKLKQKYESIHEHFNFKDFLGLSALVFGLLLSNSSLEPTTANAKSPAIQPKLEKPLIKPKKALKKKASKMKKKVLKSSKKRQRVTAANKKKSI